MEACIIGRAIKVILPFWLETFWISGAIDIWVLVDGEGISVHDHSFRNLDTIYSARLGTLAVDNPVTESEQLN